MAESGCTRPLYRCSSVSQLARILNRLAILIAKQFLFAHFALTAEVAGCQAAPTSMSLILRLRRAPAQRRDTPGNPRAGQQHPLHRLQ